MYGENFQVASRAVFRKVNVAREPTERISNIFARNATLTLRNTFLEGWSIQQSFSLSPGDDKYVKWLFYGQAEV